MDLLTTGQAARELGCSPRTVQRMIDDGRLKAAARLDGPTGFRLVTRAEVERVSRLRDTASPQAGRIPELPIEEGAAS